MTRMGFYLLASSRLLELVMDPSEQCLELVQWERQTLLGSLVRPSRYDIEKALCEGHSVKHITNIPPPDGSVEYRHTPIVVQ